jgi:hypothetical protein
MTDLERLELAAKAAGIRYRKPHPEYTGSFGLFLEDEAGNIVGTWRPLPDGGESIPKDQEKPIPVHWPALSEALEGMEVMP